MKPGFLHSVGFRIGLAIVLVEVAALAILGSLYARRFSHQVDLQLRRNILKPGALIAEGALKLDAVAQVKIMERIVGPGVIEAMVVGANGNIFHSLEEKSAGQSVSNLAWFNPAWLVQVKGESLLMDLKDQTNSFLVAISPVTIGPGKTPFLYTCLKLRTTEARREKVQLGSLFALGSAASVILTTAALIICFRWLVAGRLGRAAEVVAQVAAGDLSARTRAPLSRDEVGLLQQGIDTMAVRLQHTIISLEQSVADLQKSEAARRQGEESFRRLFDAAPAPLVLTRRADSTLLMANRAAVRLFEAGPEAIAGMPVSQFYRQEADRQRLLRLIAEQGQVDGLEVGLTSLSGRSVWGSLSAHPIDYLGEPCLLVGVIDLTERQQREKEIRRLNRLYAVLSQVNQAVVRTRQREDLLRSICGVAVESGGFKVAAVVWLDRESQTISVAAKAGEDQGFLDGVRQPFSRGEKGMGLFQAALWEEKPQISNDYQNDPRGAKFHPLAVQLGLHSLGAFPIRTQSLVQGVLCVTSTEKEFFQKAEVDLLEEVAANISFALDNLETEAQRRRAEEALRENEQRFSVFMSHLPAAAFIKDAFGRTVFANPYLQRLFDWQDWEDKTTPELVPGVQANKMTEDDRKALEQGFLDTQEVIVDARGQTRTFETLKFPIRMEGKPVLLGGIAIDITQLTQTEQALRERTEDLDRFFNLSLDLLCIADVQGRFLRLNPQWEKTLGFTREEMLGQPFMDFVHPEDHACTRAAIQELASQKEVINFTNRYRRQDGSYRWLEWRSVPAGAMVYAAARDITERIRFEEALRETNETLRQSLVEKTSLLKEVHHRVKNNLQIISSLLNLQISHEANPAVGLALRTTQERLRSMALLHETLYRSESLAWVDFAAYVENLCAHLFRAFGSEAGRVKLLCQTPPMELSLDQAVPCGLIINELVSNALKYAFPGNQTGCITVRLRSEAQTHLTLSVIDDGVGLPASLDPTHTSTLGLQLVMILTAQLGGRIEVERTGGTSFHLRFLVKPVPV